MYFTRIAITSAVCLMTILTLSSQTTNPNYDPDLAEELGADDYGMKQYVFVILRSGPNESTDKALRDSCFAGHLANIKRLVQTGDMIVAGPFMKNDLDYRGIFILDVPTVDKARELLKTDPAIDAGFLSLELVPWYGSAALPEYLEASDKVWKVGF